MKKLKKMELNARLLLVFFTAVFLLSVVHFFVYAHLLNTMETEEAIISQQQAASAKMRLDAAFSEIQEAYQELTVSAAFSIQLEPDAYQLLEMSNVAQAAYMDVTGIRRWFVVLRSNNLIISNNGNHEAEYYFTNLCSSEVYTQQVWEEILSQSFSRIVLPEAEHIYLTTSAYGERGSLMPMAIRPYYNYTYTTVLLLDMDAICKNGDDYLGENLYLFSEGGELLYTTDSLPLIDEVPAAEKLTGADNTKYAVQQWTVENGIHCVKLLTVDQSADIVRNSFITCLAVALGALAVIAVLVLTSVKSLLHPVNQMLNMLRQHTERNQGGNIYSACEELEQILLSREQQTVALAQRDAALSEYFLQSRMKNVYVAMDQQPGYADGTAYILYIQVQYHENAKGSFSMSWAELENCLQDMMSGVLNRLFETTMIFQLEPGRFAARVTLSRESGSILDPMARFMQRLEEEREFAWFTVVLSEALTADVDLADIYVQVQEAAQLAKVCDTSQLLTLPVQESIEPGFQFSLQDEQALCAHIRNGKIQEATAMAQQLLQRNLEVGINHAQMEMLCIAIVNAVSSAMTVTTSSAEKIAAVSGVYSKLTSRCSTGRDYISAVTNFICASGSSAEEAQVDPLLNALQKYLEENYHREFTIEEMADALWVSRGHLSTYYKSKTGTNLSESIQLFRIQKSLDLLKNPELTIGQIGAMVGIPGSNTFTRNFRKYTGMTPKEYRLKYIQ